MKTFTIVLLAILANLLLFIGILVLSNVQNLDHLSAVNWLTFGPIAVLYAIFVGLSGLLMGSIVNGLLVYPKHRFRNYSVSEINVGLVCLLGVIYFAWATGSFNDLPVNHHLAPVVAHNWFHSDLLVKDISERGFRAF